jgi:hypothetical protein
MKFAEIRIMLTLQGPILTEASTAGDPGIDSPFARNYKDQLYIPFSLVKGKLREAWAELAEVGISFPSFPKKWFGSKPGEGSWDPLRGRLHFTDFVDATTPTSTKGAAVPTPPARARKTSTGINMDHARKSAEEGAIQIMEKPFEAGACAEFEGICWFFAQSDAEINSVMHDLRILFSWLTSLGADRTVGFGRFLGARVAEDGLSIKDIPAEPVPVPPPAEVLDFSFDPLEPFCIAQKHLTKYLFEGSEVIPGGALKGTLASMLLEMLDCQGFEVGKNLSQPWNKLGEHFSKIRFTHAFPSGKSRPIVPPLSLVKFGKSEAKDVALSEDSPFLGADENTKPCAPAFQIDWKDDSDVKEHFGWPKRLKRDLRVRHEHDSETRRAMDEQLFAYESVAPEEGITWRASVDLSDVDATDQPQVWGCLTELFKLGFLGLGKTKARTGAVQWSARQDEPAALRDGLFIITLQTPAFLCDPQKAAGESPSLFNLYKTVWSDLSKDASGKPALELVRFFARQSLEGGYLGQRFRKNRPYNPFFLTSAGSVFVLKPVTGMETQASALVNKWRDHGLPLPSWVDATYGKTWQENPFLPQNGYGEIAVNLDCHWKQIAEPWKEAANG